MTKRLYKDGRNKRISGVCAGIANYFALDPTLVRLVWALVTLLSAAFPGVLIYIVCAIVIPDDPDGPTVIDSY